MRKKITRLIIAMIICGIITILMTDKVCAKVKVITIDLTGNKERVKRPGMIEKACKVKITNSNSSVVKTQYVKKKNDRYIDFVGKSKGISDIRVRCYTNNKTKTYKYQVRVIKSRHKTDLDYAKEAFKLQNMLREENDVTQIEWSDELYEFCIYRLKVSGYDSHENLGRDIHDYFGDYADYCDLMFGENLYSGGTLPQRAIQRWMDSEKHFINMMDENHKCGAIACMNGMWCALFFDEDKEVLSGWKDMKIKGINIKRYDSISEDFVEGSVIGYYEKDNKEETMATSKIKTKDGREIYLEYGKTYVIYESMPPSGCDAAERVVINIDEDTPSELILK